MNFTGNAIQQQPSLIPQQQIVVPPITIPNGFQAAPKPPTYYQLTAHGKDAAKNIPLGPNSKVAIFEDDPDVNIFYYRETNEYGNDVAFTVNSFEEVKEPPPPEYLTKPQFDSALSEAFSNFAKQLKEELKEELKNG